MFRDDPDDCTVLFFTEYSLTESAIGPIGAKFPGLTGLAKDTPDVVVLITQPEPILIAIEAKMYDRPSKPDLVKQLTTQKVQLALLCDHLAGSLNAQKVRLEHWALLPAKLAAAMPDLGTPILTWEQVLDMYADVDQRYFHAVLATALARYDTLVSKWVGYQDGDLAGAKLVARRLAGDDAWQYMGAAGGLAGRRVAAAIADGSWATRQF